MGLDSSTLSLSLSLIPLCLCLCLPPSLTPSPDQVHQAGVCVAVRPGLPQEDGGGDQTQSLFRRGVAPGTERGGGGRGESESTAL